MLAAFIMEQKSSNYVGVGGHKLKKILPTGIINTSHGVDVSHSYKRKVTFVRACQRGYHREA